MDLFYKKALKPSALDYKLTRPFAFKDRPGTFAENYAAARDQMFTSGRSDSMANMLFHAYKPYLNHVNKTLKENGIVTQNFRLNGGLTIDKKDHTYAGLRNEIMHNPAYLMTKDGNPVAGYLGKDDFYYKKANALIKTIKEYPDLFPEMQDITIQSIEQGAIERALNDHAELQGLTERSPGFSKAFARFAGSMRGAATDPVVAVSMIMNLDPKMGLGKLMLREALVGGVSEAVIQERVYKWYGELGLDYSYEDFVTAVSTGSALGFILPGAFKIGEQTVKLTNDWVQKGLEIFKVNEKKLSPLGDDTKAMEQGIKDLADSNPHKNPDNLENIAKHENAVETAKNQLINNENVDIDPIDPADLSDLELNKKINQDNQHSVHSFDPNEIEVDAKTFQFKEGGDAFGVTDKLKNTKKWDTIAAGTVTVFERADGKKFIADGHQRLGLAKRIMSEDPSQNIKMNAFVLREADGISAEFAMVSAAITNIIRGTGSDLDAAKIYRSNKGLIQEQFADIIPPSSAMFRKAQDLSKLTDDNWGMIINKVIPSDFGAIVGRVIPDDPAIQTAAINVFSRQQVDNQFQAEAIVRQVKATETDTSVQTSLFGDEVEVESLVVERAKILDEAKRIIKRDRHTSSKARKRNKQVWTGCNRLCRSSQTRN